MRQGSWIVCTLALLFLVSALSAQQVKESVVYSFGTNPDDGIIPNGGLVFDGRGNIYGTTRGGGPNFAGTAFELTPMEDGTWAETVIYKFCSSPNCADGAGPFAGLLSDNSGNLYGTTNQGGSYSACGDGGGCGTVFELSPTQSGGWAETVLWSFGGDGDGQLPWSRLVRDDLGNLYGTTEHGGSGLSTGAVFELSPGPAGTWSESALYRFCVNGPPCPDGAFPIAGVSLDKAGNLYGTTSYGANDGQWGTVYELSPGLGGEWTLSTLHRFNSQTGGQPYSAVNFDSAGNLYGTASGAHPGDPGYCGNVWRLTRQPGNAFKAFVFEQSGADGCVPLAGVFIDNNAKTVIGTTSTGGAFNAGTLFKITGTKHTVLDNFCRVAGCADGSTPSASLTANGGALYSTTAKGGTFNQGVVFQIKP
ncbi:MAG: choice-of-anchor tandem repeat GloVer-containing protein [Terriglobales bacterium]